MPGDQEVPFLALQKDGLIRLWIYVQPRASKSGFAGIHDGYLKLAITSPPVDNKANSAVISYLAEYFHIARNCIRLESGEKSRRKVFCIKGIGIEVIRGHLEWMYQQECTAHSDQ